MLERIIKEEISKVQKLIDKYYSNSLKLDVERALVLAEEFKVDPNDMDSIKEFLNSAVYPHTDITVDTSQVLTRFMYYMLQSKGVDSKIINEEKGQLRVYLNNEESFTLFQEIENSVPLAED